MTAVPPAKHTTRNLLVAAGVLMLGVAGWMVWQRMGQKPVEGAAIPAVAGVDATAAEPAASATAAPAVAVATPPATAPVAEAPPAAVDAATGEAPTADSESPLAMAHYGHGGPNTKINRVRTRFVREPSPEELLAREQARQQNELAAAAALEQQNTAAQAATHTSAPEQPKERKSFLCRVFKKCDPPKRKGAAAPEPPPAPAKY
jgi:hypothetical protein